ncbi:hypothetical protein NC653_010381 [Populus alba x Populus x berolinensis]|uniref:Uncharacterized protein n=1 Tax=Populus alba x Populus x berolinensis TaxID=444605 RepID=A0AAD6QZL9_9ROSI|nr:hypothetical protein NC653_010381 [Populus alba x Populus x berolinensis]
MELMVSMIPMMLITLSVHASLAQPKSISDWYLRDGSGGCNNGAGFVKVENVKDLYVRVDALELAQYDKKSRGFLAKKGMLAGLVLSIAAAVFFVIMFLFWLIKRKKTAKGRQLKFPFNIPTSLNGSLSGKEVGGSRTSEYVPVFDIDIILEATESRISPTSLDMVVLAEFTRPLYIAYVAVFIDNKADDI